MAQKEMTVKSFDHTNSQLYKELEIINFKELSKSLDPEKRGTKSFFNKISRSASKVSPVDAWKKQPQTQIILFQRSMRLLLLCGQCIGLNPVIQIANMDIKKIRFKYFSVRYMYCVLVLIFQAAATILCVHRMFRNSVSITILAFISFFAAATITTFLFLRIAVKWPSLMKDISNSGLDSYIDASVQARCFNYTAVLLAIALLEHLLSNSAKISLIYGTQAVNETQTVYERFLEVTFPWFKELGVPFNVPTGIVLQILNIISTISWSFSDVFIVCMSFYLVSILNQINKTITEADKTLLLPTSYAWISIVLNFIQITSKTGLTDKTIHLITTTKTTIPPFYHPSFWSRIREDYTKATRLIVSFDNVISGVILTSFASNLFFICLQLFHVVADALQDNMTTQRTNGPLNGTDSTIYFTFSLMFVLGRFLAVSFIAARVNSASLAPASVLYTLPSSAYCSEVQRFLEQIHGSNVALSGLQFFYVTKGLILSVAGTIVTYELVLLQFNGEV